MKIILLSLMVLGVINSYAVGGDTTRPGQLSCTDSVVFDGYYVVLYTKREIKDVQRAKQRKIEGKSYKVPFESSILGFFVSKDSLARRPLSDIIEDLPVKNKGEIFIECTNGYSEMIGKEICGKKDQFSDCKWPKLFSYNKYFTVNKSSRYCFEIFEISGWFVKLKIDTEEKHDALGRKARYIAPALKNNFNAYFFLGYKAYSNDVVSLKDEIRLWKVVPPIFE
jgi:hypothetical protein